jgi:hypothetical protein
VIEREHYLRDVKPGEFYDHEYVVDNGTIQIGRLEPEEWLNARYTEIANEPANTKDGALESLGEVSAIPVALDPKSAYIIAGGLGGLGRSISTWMAERGARHLVFVSRTGGTKPEAMDAIQELHIMGVKTDIVTCSVSNKEALVTAVEQITQSTTVKGVVHATVGEDVSFGLPNDSSLDSR